MKLLVTSDKEKGIDHLLIVTTMTSDVLYLFLVRSIKINANINISTISLQLHVKCPELVPLAVLFVGSI